MNLLSDWSSRDSVALDRVSVVSGRTGGMLGIGLASLFPLRTPERGDRSLLPKGTSDTVSKVV